MEVGSEVCACIPSKQRTHTNFYAFVPHPMHQIYAATFLFPFSHYI